MALQHRWPGFRERLIRSPRCHCPPRGSGIQTETRCEPVTISRASGTLTFRADSALIAAMKPRLCGHCGDPVRERAPHTQ